MAVALRAYYDASGNAKSGDKFITLAGYAGPAEACSIFDLEGCVFRNAAVLQKAIP